MADYRPEEIATEKIKKQGDFLSLKLVRNPDIIASLGKRKAGQYVVGFALETENELEICQREAKGETTGRNCPELAEGPGGRFCIRNQ